MPRTKSVRRRTTAVKAPTAHQLEQTIADFDLYVQSKRKTLNAAYENKLKQLNDNYQIFLATYGPFNKTIGQLNIEALKENIAPKSQIPILGGYDSSTSSVKDDGYVTDAPSVSSSVRNTRRVSRSLTRSNTKNDRYGSSNGQSSSRLGPKRTRSSSASTGMGPPRSCRPRYRTPMNRVAGTPQYPPITPKVAPNTPLAVLRRPRNGEMVVSLSGSPLLVNSMNGVNDKANCNIPLADGTVLSLMPSKLRESGSLELPFEQMKPETRQELLMLQMNLNAYLKKKASKYKL